MTDLRFEPSGFHTTVSVGDRIVDVCDDHPESGVPFSCRAANCGTCRVRVLEGADAFARPEDDELGVLEIHGDGPDVRLACQLRVKAEAATIALEVVEP